MVWEIKAMSHLYQGMISLGKNPCEMFKGT